MALLAYDLSRFTEDLDLVVVSTSDIEEKLLAVQFIPGSELSLAKGKLKIIRYVKDDRILDLMLYQDPEFSKELLKTAVPANILGQDVKVLSADGIALTKLLSFRHRDIEDILHLLPRLNRTYLEKWATVLSIPQERLEQVYREGTSESYLEEKYPTLAKVLRDSKKGIV